MKQTEMDLEELKYKLHFVALSEKIKTKLQSFSRLIK